MSRRLLASATATARCQQARQVHSSSVSKTRQRWNDLWAPQPKATYENTKIKFNTTNLLEKAGFIVQSNAGVYQFLPLGLRVLDKIERLIDKHMRNIGASKVSLSSFSNQKLWDRSGRLDSATELFKFQDRSKTNWLLAPTHEEEITQVLADAQYHGVDQRSVRLYQVGRKYRDELRPRGGLLRAKEFIMKDLYTFDPTPDAAHATYDQVRTAYRAFFDELAVPYVEARADSGSMGGSLSHEFHFPSDQGEDTVITCDNCDHARNVEFTGSIERVAKQLPLENPDAPSTIEASSILSCDFISEDRFDLVRVLMRASDVTSSSQNPTSARDLVNTHVVKAALDGHVAVATGIEEAAVKKIFCTPSPSLDQLRKRRIYYVLDKRLTAEHLLYQLQVEQDLVDIELWAIRSVSKNPDSTTSIDLRLPRTGDQCPDCKEGKLKVRSAVEVGHTFHLGTRYTKMLPARKTNETREVEMGCHGIGVSRLVAAASRFYLAPRGRKGDSAWLIQWPTAIAPYQVCIVASPDDPRADEAYDLLTSEEDGFAPLDVVIHDQSHHSNAKISDATVLGCPVVLMPNYDRGISHTRDYPYTIKNAYTRTGWEGVHRDQLQPRVRSMLATIDEGLRPIQNVESRP